MLSFWGSDGKKCYHRANVLAKSAFTRKTLVSAQNAIKSSR